MNSHIRAHIDRAVRTIVETAAPDKIILFGSQARGGTSGDSDVDLLVVMPVAGAKRDARIRIGLAISGSAIPTDVLVATPDEVERFGDIPGSLVYPAIHEGLVLYERCERPA
jgi:predicted nucleotidyltransferase